MADKKDLASNKKKKALERTKTKIDQCKTTANTNPTPVDGSLPTSYDGSPSGGVDRFTSDLTDAWQSTRAQEFSDWIIDDVKEIRNAWNNISQDVDSAISMTDPEDNVPKDSEEAKSKWDSVP